MANHTRLSTETLLNLISLPIMTILGILAICATIRYGYRRRGSLAALYQQLKTDSLARYFFDRRRRAERVAITSDSMLRAEDRILRFRGVAGRTVSYATERSSRHSVRWVGDLVAGGWVLVCCGAGTSGNEICDGDAV